MVNTVTNSSESVLHSLDTRPLIIPITVANREMGTGISEANKRVAIFLYAVRGGKQVSSYFGQELGPRHDQSLCFLLKQHPPLVYPIQMLREFACHLPVQEHSKVGPGRQKPQAAGRG